ncbi:RICIN domain-containing protein [Streptomyces sp. WM6378]|uniref:RICIN domain-containing protein n=1 Tax=Streptomyces sp. WM6378 TaxID=1415557 RepID=UPI0006AF3ED0|nr:RICIN domain-containing protein [Streptomyces sp. WM6378]
MSRTLRAAMALGISVSALSGGAATAYADEAPRAAAASPAAVQLQVEHSGQCLTILDASLRNGANAAQSKCDDSLPNQLFHLEPTGSASFEARIEHSGKCLEVENSGTKAGANVQQWWCTEGPQQRWRLVMVDVVNELYELRPTHTTDRCLDIAGASLKDGANAQSWTCNGTPAQRWRILPVKS